MTTPLLSGNGLAAVVLNYRTIRETIALVQAVQRSDSPPDRVHVVDNASKDGSVGRLRSELTGVDVLYAENNNGFSAGCNIGIRAALRFNADRILVLNPDVLVPSRGIALLDRILSAAPADILGPVLVRSGDSGRIESAGIGYSRITGRMRQRFAGALRSAVTVPELADVDAVSGAAMLIRRQVFEAIGLFAEEYFYGFEDLEFCLRAKAAGFRIVCAGSAVVEHEGAASIGRSSPRRLYFAARNHLLLATRVGPQAWPIRTVRAANIVALNMAHAVLRSGAPTAEGLRAVSRGVRDHLRERYGGDETPPT